MKHYGIKRRKCRVKKTKHGSNVLTIYRRSNK